MEIIKTTNCQVCDQKLSNTVLDMGEHPLCDDLIPVETNDICKEYPINISLCNNCLTANQTFNIKKEILFPENYHYRPRFTQDVINGMKELVKQADNCLGGLNNKLVCDIGCNDGTLLDIFKEHGALTCGIEPTGAASEAKTKHDNIIQDYFNYDTAKNIVDKVGYPDVITFTNVFAHIEDLKLALSSLKSMLKDNTLVIIENHYLGTVIKTNQFDTFYHEHPRTYSARSFEFIARQLDFKLQGIFFPKRYGGNIRVYLAQEMNKLNIKSDDNCLGEVNESFIVPEFRLIQDFINNWKTETRNSIIELASIYGKIYGKSFPGRAAILLKLINIDNDVMPVIYEKEGSKKLNHFAPGTRIKILSDELWISKKENPEVILIWAWHIHEEIAGYLRSAGYKGRLFTPLPVFKEIL
tara:strand:- start:597 stop:1832 length:1236 start_codon:yes stop_codon:yes gene_type:complete